MAGQNLSQAETRLDQELRSSSSTVSEACLVGDDLPGASILSRSASLLRALSTTSLKAPTPKVEPIEIHLSMPDGVLLPIDDLIAAHERVCPCGNAAWRIWFLHISHCRKDTSVRGKIQFEIGSVLCRVRVREDVPFWLLHNGGSHFSRCNTS
jgi:hypothetical protein